MALFILLCATIGMALGYPGGPPSGVCPGLVPTGPITPHVKQAGDGGYSITVDGLSPDSAKAMYNYTDGQTYIVTLQGTNTFRGFIVEGRDSSNGRIGTFVLNNDQQQFLNCSGNSESTTVAHKNPSRVDFSTQVFNWTAPSEGNGYVNFRFTVVQSAPRYYGLLSAAAVALNRSAAVTNPTRTPENYRTIFRSPEGCTRASCAIYVGIDINAGDGAYIDVYLEANATAWVGVGFSATRSMFDADVLACNIVTDDSPVVAADTWNGPGPSRTNTLDTNQDVTLFSGSLTNGRLSCTIARRSAGSGDIEANSDVNLDGNYYVMYGWADVKQPNGALAGHVGVPTLTTQLYNVVQGTTTGGSVTVAATPLVLALLAAIALFVNKGY